MTSRRATLAKLAEKFGRCLATCLRANDRRLLPVDGDPRRLRRIARLMDRLSRKPPGATWHQRALRIERELATLSRAGQPA